MPLTPKQVVDELAMIGRHVTERALTDWRSPRRLLLPKLTANGRGRGKGKRYAWTESNILDRVAFVADRVGWDTRRIIFSLWCCGFDVPTEALRAAWLDAIATALRAYSKQERSASETIPNDTYFEQLGDVFDSFAIHINRTVVSGNKTLSKSGYELTQVVLTMLFASAIPRRFSQEIDAINPLFTSDLARGSSIPASTQINLLNIDFFKKFRRVANSFEVEKAVRRASQLQFEQTIFIWNAICRLFAVFLENLGLGLAEGRKFRVVFGPPILSVIITALQTAGGNELLALVRILEQWTNELEQAKAAGVWRDAEGLKKFIVDNAPKGEPEIPRLWNEFWSQIDLA